MARGRSKKSLFRLRSEANLVARGKERHLFQKRAVELVGDELAEVLREIREDLVRVEDLLLWKPADQRMRR